MRITAPAGYGKTTLLAQWAARRPAPVRLADARPPRQRSGRLPRRTWRPPIHARRRSTRGVFATLGSAATSVWVEHRAAARPPPLAHRARRSCWCSTTTTSSRRRTASTPWACSPGSCRTARCSRSPAAAPSQRAARAPARERRAARARPRDSWRSATTDARALLAQARAWSSRSDDASALNARAEGWAGGLYLAALALRDGRRPERAHDAVRAATTASWPTTCAPSTSARPAARSACASCARTVGPRAHVGAALRRRAGRVRLGGGRSRRSRGTTSSSSPSTAAAAGSATTTCSATLLRGRARARRAGGGRRAAPPRGGVARRERDARRSRSSTALAAGDVDGVGATRSAATPSRSTAAAAPRRWSAGSSASTTPELLDRHPAVAVHRHVDARAARADRRREPLGRERRGVDATTARCPTAAPSLRPWAALVRAVLCRQGAERHARRRAGGARRAPADEHPARAGRAAARGGGATCCGDADAAERARARRREASAAASATSPARSRRAELALIAIDRGDDDARRGGARGGAGARRPRAARRVLAGGSDDGRPRAAAAAAGRRRTRASSSRARSCCGRCSPRVVVARACRCGWSSRATHAALADVEGARTLLQEARRTLAAAPRASAALEAQLETLARRSSPQMSATGDGLGRDADGGGAAPAAVPDDAPLVPGDRRAPVRLAQHGQDAGDLRVPQARRQQPQRGDRARRGARPGGRRRRSSGGRAPSCARAEAAAPAQGAGWPLGFLAKNSNCFGRSTFIVSGSVTNIEYASA